ncbi:MAG: multidrug efflux RND transporter permease subunit [Rhodospirillaceae bacterium]|nr:multidrug efflux RND transporter permease subunit [Rhodospirillaceae bacterium]
MRFPHFFIDRPIFAAVLSIVVVILGGLAYFTLPVAQYPEIAPPTIVVRAAYPGANAETVAATVATPLEQEINGVEDMLYMSSYSSSDGAMSLTITFKIGTNLDTAQVLVQNRVAVALPRLPEDVRRIGVTTRKSSPDLMMVVHMLSPDKTYDQLYVSNFAAMRVRDQLLRLDGVGDVIIFGAREYSMRVWLNPDKLSAYGLTAGDVVRTLREQNVQVSGGQLGQQPAPDSNQFQIVVTTQGRFEDVRQFRNVIVKNDAEGRLVRLADVARVELGARDYVTNSYLNGDPAVALAIFQRPGTNALAAADDIRRTMERLKADFPKGIDYRIVYNPTEFIRDSVNAVYTTIGEAALLVVLVIVIFLQTWRATIIPIIAIPISLIGTFAVMAAFGFSLNTLTLFGLVLAIGIVVDDAIVVVENVERNIAKGMSPRDAAHETMDEVGGALVSIALVLTAVFVPAALVPGITGLFYQQFALTIAVATLVSAFVSLTLSPGLSALLLKAGHGRSAPRFFALRWLRGGADLFNRGFDRLSTRYAGGVGVLSRRKGVMLLLYAALVGATVFISGRVPGGFIPQLDQGYAIVVIQLPEGASLTRTDAVTKRVSEIVKSTPGVRNAVAFAGFSGATFTNASNTAVVFAGFAPFDERVKSGRGADAIIADLTKRLGAIQEAFIIAVPPPPVRGLGNQGGFRMQIQDRTGAGVRQLVGAAYAMIGQARATPGLVGVFTTFNASSPQVFLRIDRRKAQMLNVPIANIFEALEVNLGSSYVNDFNLFDRTFQVRAQADERFRLASDDVLRLKVRSSTGQLVPLGTLVTVEQTSGPDLVQRYNMYTSVPLQGNAAPGTGSSQALDAMERLAKAVLPPGMDFEWTELAFQERATGGAAMAIFALSVVFVFLVLAAQYESWLLPLAIILIVPLTILAALIGVSLRGMDNNILTQIGLITLVGLAAKNAILIVEFARQLEAEGKSMQEALVEACRLRLRPILMTAFAFIFGVVPLMIAEGAGAEMRQSLGTAVFSGMLGVTILGLFLTPVFYATIRSWFGRQPSPAAGKAAVPAGHG